MAARMAGFSINLAGPISDITYFRQHIAPLLDDEEVNYLGHLSHVQLKAVVGRLDAATPSCERRLRAKYMLLLAQSACR